MKAVADRGGPIRPYRGYSPVVPTPAPEMVEFLVSISDVSSKAGWRHHRSPEGRIPAPRSCFPVLQSEAGALGSSIQAISLDVSLH